MFNPYPYQTDCLDAIDSARNSGRNCALVVMAGGLGKTVTVAFDVRDWLSRNGGRVLFLCHQNDILYQARKTFEVVLPENCSFGYFHGQEKHLHEVTCLFASFKTMRGSLDHFARDEFDYIVVDESHHTHARTYRHVVDYFNPKFLLGMTATPDRKDQKDIRSFYGQEVFFLPLDEALAQGFLTPVDYRMLSDHIELDGITDVPIKGLSVAEINRRVFVPKRDEEIARIIAEQTDQLDSPRTIIFCSSIRHCKHFSQFVPNSVPIHSKISQKERVVRLELFRQGVVKTILTVDAFNEGIDIPQSNVIVFLRSTASPTIFLQQLGRGLRKSKGKDRVSVLDFVGNCERINMVYDLWQSVSDQSEVPTRLDDVTESRPPMTINLGSHPGFSEKIVNLKEILDRLHPILMSEVPNLLAEYSGDNEVPANQITAGTGKKVWWKCQECNHRWQASGAKRVRGSGCPACAGKVVTESNCLATVHPDIAKEFSSRNPVRASEVIAGTGKKLWWRCSKCGYEWQASGAKRVRGSGCPACAGKVVTESNCLATVHPDIAKELSSRNSIDGSQVVPGSNKKLWWRCSKCGYEWETQVADRVAGKGCLACVGRAATPENNLANNLTLAREFSSRNEIKPSEITPKSNRKVWWKCSKCSHEWQAIVSSRSGGKGCPACSGRAATPENNLANNLTLAREFSSRNEIKPSEITPKSNRKVWWKCSKCSHEWETSVRSRTTGRGCPICNRPHSKKKKAARAQVT